MQQRPIIYHSGVDRESHVKLLAQERAAGMVSAADVMQPKLLNAIVRHPGVPVVVDSGFKNKPRFEDYVALLDFLDREHPGRFRWFASYDYPADQERSDASYDELVARLPRLRHQIRWIFHPMWGARSERLRCLQKLEDACKQQRSIALGGLVPLIRRSVRDTLTLLQEVGEVLNASYPVEAHVLGISSPDILAWLRTQPWVASVDSSRWIRAARAHEVVLLNGVQRKASALQLPLSQEECAALNLRTMQTLTDGSPRQLYWDWDENDRAASEFLLQNRSRDSALSTLLRHRGKRVLYVPLDQTSPSLIWYIPLFTVSGRGHGLLAFQREENFPQEADWSVAWDVDARDGPLLPRSHLFLVDGRLMTGIFSHDDVFNPRLCRYRLAIALQVAKSLVPFS